MPRPQTQINDEIREMTVEEYAELIASGWTEESQEPSSHHNIVVIETPEEEP